MNLFCRVHDSEAMAPLDPALLESWEGRKPTGVEELDGRLRYLVWEPGWGAVALEVSHILPGHPVAALLGSPGNVFVAQAIGGF